MSSEKTAASGPYLSLAACVALTCMGPLSGLAQSALGPILPQITAHFADEPNAGVLVRLMVSGLSAAMILGALASGFLAERIGELRLLLIALVIYGLSGAAGFLADSLYLMVACRLILGICNSAAGGLAMALITTEIAPASRDRWLGFYVVSGTVGVVFLVGIVGVLAHYDWRYVFLLYLIAWPLALFAALVFPKRDKAARAAARAEAAAGYGIPWQKMLVSLLIGAIGTTTFMYLPYHLASIGEGRPEQLAPVMMASTAVASVGSASYGWVRRYLSAVPIYVGALALAGAGLLIVAATQDRAMVFVGIAIHAAGLGTLMPHLFSSCAAATPAIYRARMMGFIRATFYGGPLLAQVALELVLGRFGPSAAVAAVSLICLGGAVLALAFRRDFVPVE
jgi:MFS family permease